MSAPAPHRPHVTCLRMAHHTSTVRSGSSGRGSASSPGAATAAASSAEAGEARLETTPSSVGDAIDGRGGERGECAYLCIAS